VRSRTKLYFNSHQRHHQIEVPGQIFRPHQALRGVKRYIVKLDINFLLDGVSVLPNVLWLAKDVISICAHWRKAGHCLGVVFKEAVIPQNRSLKPYGSANCLDCGHPELRLPGIHALA